MKTNEASELKLDGVFVAIGHDPATELFKGKIDMDESGYLITAPDSTATNIRGVYAAGDVKDKVVEKAGQLKEKAVDLKDKAMDKAGEAKDQTADIAGDVKDKTVEKAGQIYSKADYQLPVQSCDRQPQTIRKSPDR